MECRCNCGYLAVIVAILLGVALGVLYSFGLVATAIIFWVYLLSGILALLLTPLYAAGCSICFARYRTMLLAAAVGTVLTAVVGLIVSVVASIVVTSIVVGLATAFLALLLGTLVCLSRCLCNR